MGEEGVCASALILLLAAPGHARLPAKACSAHHLRLCSCAAKHPAKAPGWPCEPVGYPPWAVRKIK